MNESAAAMQCKTYRGQCSGGASSSWVWAGGIIARFAKENHRWLWLYLGTVVNFWDTTVYIYIYIQSAGLACESRVRIRLRWDHSASHTNRSPYAPFFLSKSRSSDPEQIIPSRRISRGFQHQQANTSRVQRRLRAWYDRGLCTNV